ncbi:MAG: hypothetical protein SGJ27_13070 [Candidatus Melainabacteria bacterium]|nr:hypothetical protein [Candidatus Melainabacteria bacterium]
MSKKRRTDKNRATPSANIPDRRALEATTAKLTQLLSGQNFQSADDLNKFLMENIDSINSGKLESLSVSARDRAQDIMYKAFDASSNKQKIALAEQAIEVYADCADAFLLLAETKAKTSKEKIEYLEKGVAAGRRALGEEFFEKSDVPFWAMMETRPFMRAVDGLAHEKYVAGDIEGAIDLWKELVRLNPNDNQGVRYILLPVLIKRNRLDDADELLKQYSDDPTTHFSYSKALLLFKRFGPCEASTEALERSLKSNPCVPEYMGDFRKLPAQAPHAMAIGSPEEAVDYLLFAMGDWGDTDGALDWLLKYWKPKTSKRK